MKYWRVKGRVYKFKNGKIILNTTGEDSKKLSTHLERDVILHFFSISIKNMKIKDELILKHIEKIEDIEGMEVDISGYSKKFKFYDKKTNADIEGVLLCANTINSSI